MNVLDYLEFSTAAWLVESLGHTVWQGALAAGIAAAAARVLRNHSAQARYTVHCTAMLLTIACLPLNLLLLAPSGENPKPVAMRSATVELAAPRVVPINEAQADGVGESYEPDAPVIVLEPATRSAGKIAEASDQTSHWQRYSQWIALAYAVGMMAMALRLVAGLYGCQRLRSTARPINDSRLSQSLLRIGEKLCWKALPVVAYSARVTTPLVVGVVRPTILLPTAILSNLTPEQVESLLLHELAHIGRYDHWVNLIQRIMEAVLFFHPAVWWLSHKISIEREYCCDDLAIRWGSEPCDYAETLVRMSEVRHRAAGLSMAGAGTLAATGKRPSQLRGRVLHILGAPLPGPTVGLTRGGIALLLAIVVTSAALLAAAPQGNQSEQQDETTEVEAEPTAEPTEPDETGGDEMATISGKIVLDDGSPADVKGWLYYHTVVGTGEHSSKSASGTVDQFTDTFDCEVAAGIVRLAYFPDGYAPAWVGPFELEPRQQLDSVEISLNAGISAKLFLSDEDGQAVPGATVVAHPHGEHVFASPVRELTTDGGGELLLEHLANRSHYKFTVTAPGYEPLRTAPLRVEEGESLRLTMVRSSPTEGVIRFADGTPAPSTKLRLLREWTKEGKAINPGSGGDGFWGRTLATTDAQGRFQLDQLADGSKYVFVIEAVDGVRAIVDDLEAGQQGWQLVLPQRKDLVIYVKGDLDKLPQRRGKAFASVRQPVDLTKPDGSTYGELIGADVPLDAAEGGGWAIFRGLAVDLREDAPPQKVRVGLGYRHQDGSTSKTVDLNQAGGTAVTFELPGGDGKKSPLVDQEHRLQVLAARRLTKTNDISTASNLVPERFVEWSPAPGQTDWLLLADRPPLFTERDIESAQLQPAPDGQDWQSLAITLTEAAGQSMSSRTSALLEGQGDAQVRIVTLLDGEVLFAPRLISTIGRNMAMTGSLESEQLKKLEEVLNVKRDSDGPSVDVGGDPEQSGVIRGEVIGPVDGGEDLRYSVTLEYEALRQERERRTKELPEGTRSLGPRAPGVVVAAGEKFEFTGVPAGTCILQAVAMNQQRKQVFGQPEKLQLEIKPKHVTDVGIAFTSSSVSTGWVESVAAIGGEKRGVNPRNLSWGEPVAGLQAAIELAPPPGVQEDPTRRPGPPVGTDLQVVFHVRNVAQRDITFVSELHRQGDRFTITDAAGNEIELNVPFQTGWPIDKRWNLKPGEVARLKVRVSPVKEIETSGEYRMQYTLGFNNRRAKDEIGNVVFPRPGDYQQELVTGVTTFFLNSDRPDDEPSQASEQANNPEAAPSDDTQGDLGRLQGKWTLVSGQSNGQPMVDLLAKRGFANLRVEFAEDRMTMRGMGEADHVYRVELDESQTPKHLDTTIVNAQGKAPPGSRSKGIYRLDGNKLTLCLAADYTVDRPAAFEAAEGSRLSLLELRRVADDGASAPFSPLRQTTDGIAEVEEVAIAIQSGKALLDLDTGNTLGPIARSSPRGKPKFELYASFVAEGDRTVQVLMGQAGEYVEIDKETWKSGALERVREQLRTDRVQRESVILAKPTDTSPTRWAVKTRLGAVVLVETEYRAKSATELSNDVEGFVVRYRVLKPTRQPSEADPANSLTVKFRDENGQPIPNVKVRVYDGPSYWTGKALQYKTETVTSDAQGDATWLGLFDRIPEKAGYWIEIFLQEDAKWRPPNRLTGWRGGLNQPHASNPLVNVQQASGGLEISVTLREECPTDIEIVDAATGKRKHFAQLLFKDARVDQWTRAALQDYVGDPGGDDVGRLGLDFFTTMVPEMSNAQFMATREGYYPVEFKLTEKLSPEKTLRQRVELRPAPLIELTILDATGKAVVGAELEYLGPNVRGGYRPIKPSDAEGKITLPYPELGKLARYRVKHASSELEVEAKAWLAGADDAEPSQSIRSVVRLP